MITIIRPQLLILLAAIVTVVGPNQGSSTDIVTEDSSLIRADKQSIRFLASNEFIGVRAYDWSSDDLRDRGFKIPAIDFQYWNTIGDLSRIIEDNRGDVQENTNEVSLLLIKARYMMQHVESVDELIAIATNHMEDNDDEDNNVVGYEIMLMQIGMKFSSGYDDSGNVMARLMNLYRTNPDFFLDLSLLFLVVALAASTLYCTLQKHSC